MLVFLIHGMGRTVVSMTPLARRLRREGHATRLFGYSVVKDDLATVARSFEHFVRGRLPESGRGGPAPAYAVVGHSLGNVVARLAYPGLPRGLTRLVGQSSPRRIRSRNART